MDDNNEKLRIVFELGYYLGKFPKEFLKSEKMVTQVVDDWCKETSGIWIKPFTQEDKIYMKEIVNFAVRNIRVITES